MTASLARAAAMEIEGYDPALVIAAVNELQPLDKAGALHAIERCDEGPGLFWVLRVLFDVPDDVGFPAVELGTPAIPPPDEPAALPRFPIAIVQDVPLLVVRGYILRGLPEPVAEHVAYFREHGSLRAAALRPVVDGAREAFVELWTAAYGDAHLEQALEAVREQLQRVAR